MLSLSYGNDFSFSCKLTNFHKKGCALGLILKARVFETRKYFHVSLWRRDRHFKYPSEPRKVPAFCRAKEAPSFFSYFKTLSIGPVPQSSAVPTELILPRLGVTLTVFRPRGSVWSSRREKNWITSNLFKLWPPNLAAFPTNSSGNISKSPWRVCQHWRYHGNRVFTAMCFKICSFPINRIYFFFYY